jgi:hypothetical protein
VKALDAAFLAADKAVQAALSSAKEAVAKAETAAERRFENVNEFRAQLADQAATFMPRVEAEARMTTIRELVDELRTSDSARSGRGAGANQLWGLIAGGLGLLFAMVATVIVIVGN